MLDRVPALARRSLFGAIESVFEDLGNSRSYCARGCDPAKVQRPREVPVPVVRSVFG